MPALTKAMVMPPPIVPAPTTAALRISFAAASLGISGIFRTALSPKNA